MNSEDLKELAKQLRHPNGLKGLEIAEMMNETNIKMTVHSIDHLALSDNDKVLELGHGNCKHLPFLFNLNKKLTYYGLETSELMHKEAIKINQQHTDKQEAFFYLFDGLNFPFADNYFDKIFTVNTIYFWVDPKFLMLELYRLIKPNGILNITFAQEDFMKKLPFTQFGFTLYNNEKIKQLIATTPFKTIGSDTQTEIVKSKAGDLLQRDFATFTLKK